ncbi:Ubiquinol-cytochrome C reductase hinge protein [Popillia japonica]|uniref:Cytochrome b-c1 complex subunit 6 n=1 Tax=Popillia japonica TaxID=7064 RepID=A0AAW1N036_POPJA
MSFLKQFFPKVKADDELVDPQQELRDKCRESDHCKHLVEKYEACNERVGSRSKTTETCIEELFDLLHAIDHCVTKDLFKRLK